MSFPSFNDLSRFAASQADELQQFIAYLQGFLSAEHNDDGSHGNVTAQSLVVAGDITELGRTIGIGQWQTMSYSASNFSGSGSLSWDLSGQSPAVPYTIVGKTMTISLDLERTSLTGTGTFLKIQVPGGFTIGPAVMVNPVQVIDNGTAKVGYVIANIAQTHINVFVDQTSTTNWSTPSSSNTSILGQLVFEVA